MLINFVKMHGLGNDFIVIDERKLPSVDFYNKAAKLCNRRLGIGADQLLLLGKSDCADFRMQIFNADGSEVQMCGNGIRCLARYIREQGISCKEELKIETMAGIIKPRFIDDEIEVDMGEPILDGKKIPTAGKGQLIDHALKAGDKDFYVTCVSMGNPHCVIFVDNVADFAVEAYGPLLETHSFFPERANIEFIEVLSPTEIKMRVWERGAGETPACGTGACASVVASILNKKTNRRVKVNLPGGTLYIHWNSDNNHVYMRGTAVTVFSGQINL